GRAQEAEQLLDWIRQSEVCAWQRNAWTLDFPRKRTKALKLLTSNLARGQSFRFLLRSSLRACRPTTRQSISATRRWRIAHPTGRLSDRVRPWRRPPQLPPLENIRANTLQVHILGALLGQIRWMARIYLPSG